MPKYYICIECRYPVKTLYTSYSKADDRSLGKGVRLTQCPRCKRFADKYVEHDNVVLFIDLVLIKPQVYRHLLFNRLAREDDRFDPRIIRLSILLLLFDVYLTWARIEKATPSPQSTNAASSTSSANFHDSGGLSSTSSSSDSYLVSQPLVLQYLFFLALVAAQTLAFHAPIRLLCSNPPRIPLQFLRSFSTTTAEPTKKTPSSSFSPPYPSHDATAQSSRRVSTAGTDTSPAQPGANGTTASNASAATSPPSLSTPASESPLYLLPHYPHPTPLSTALLVSSCTKLLPLLLIVWDYDLPSAASAVSWAVFVNNVAALEILMDCGYARAVALVAIGASARGAVGWALLKAVGLEGMVGVGEGKLWTLIGDWWDA